VIRADYGFTDSTPPTETNTAEARSEIIDYLEVSHQQHKLFRRAAIVGLFAGRAMSEGINAGTKFDPGFFRNAFCPFMILL
jgi:hypothetical protein